MTEKQDPWFPIRLSGGAARAQRQPDGTFRVALGNVASIDDVSAQELAQNATPLGDVGKTLWNYTYRLDELAESQESDEQGNA